MFYHKLFNAEEFQKYKIGVLGRKKKGFTGLNEEAADLYERMRTFARDPLPGPEWDRIDKEIECIETYCTFDKIKEFYRKLFNPVE